LRSRHTVLLALFALVSAFFAVTESAPANGPGEPILVEDYQFSEEMIPGDDVQLFAKLHLPIGDGPFPAMIIVHGSSPETYDFMYKGISNFFARRGYAVLFFDKRGTGQSEGVYTETPDTMLYYARDVVAVAKYLTHHPRIDAARVGVWGHSQGGWIGPLAATLTEDIRFVINVSGPGVSPLRQIAFQRSRELLNSEKIDESEVEAVRRLYETAYGYWTSGRGYDEAAKHFAGFATKEWFSLVGWPDTLPQLNELPAESFVRKPALRFDPQEIYRIIEDPVLVLYGRDDQQIPVEESMAAIEEAKLKNPNADITIRVFEDTGHGILQRGEDNLRYFVRGYPELMLSWLKKKLG
jgi:pimeloyl-ACP methyl ester carboxylesterase